MPDTEVDPANLVEDVEPIGQRNRGKKQLRIDEARRFVEMAIKKANAGDDAAVSALTALLLGLRASEVTDRVVRDLDDDGRLLWIEFGKTKRARRTSRFRWCYGLTCSRSPRAMVPTSS